MKLIVILASVAFVSVLAKAPKDLEVHFLPIHGTVVGAPNEQHKGKAVVHGGAAAMPFEQFAKMFPMDLPPGAKAHVKVIHINPGASDADISNMIGDTLINSILSELSGGFHDNMLPLMQHAQVVGRSSEPHPCESDLKQFCHPEHNHDHDHESDIHCLGLHAAEITPECSKEIQHSLPYICSFEISRFCSIEDTMDKSVLQCLEEALDKEAAAKDKRGAAAQRFSQIQDDCKDAVVATRAIINKIKMQNVALVDRRTGEVIKSTAAFVSTSLQIGIILAIVAVVGIVLFAIWTRDDETSMIKSIQRTLRSIKGSVVANSAPTYPSKTQVMEMKGSGGSYTL